MDEKFMGDLRRHTDRLIVQGADMLNELTARKHAKQWWNLPAKFRAADEISKEEEAKAWAASDPFPPHNNAADAMRHAETSRRLAVGAGPLFSHVAGAGHELKNILIDGMPLRESAMDLRNNAEGLRAASDGRAVRRENLQPRLGAPSPSNFAYNERARRKPGP